MSNPPSFRSFSRQWMGRVAGWSCGTVRQAGAAVARLGRSALEFLYPPTCRLCGVEIPSQAANSEPLVFCDKCLEGLCSGAGLACLRCGAGIGPYVDPHDACRHCRDDSFAFESVVRLGVYENELQQAVQWGKHRGNEGVVAGLAELVWRINGVALTQAEIDVIIPIPFHRWQALFRPHNPAEELARMWGRRLNIPVATHILRKTRWTEKQSTLPPAQRRVNVKDAFAVVEGALPAGATVLLADDVLTTGTTAHEAARALKKSGASRVIVGVVARGLGRHS
ncbi:MAG: phosphoribosyltransferase family protein [Planctomycetota bacterium]|nr:phosphoribosyltransferase family protein [Planctomycetota bacterium]